MSVHLHVRIVGALLLTLALAHSTFARYFKWRRELAQASLLTRQVFSVHCFFIALIVGMTGACSLFWTDALLAAGSLNRVVLTGFVFLWLIRLIVQLFVYDRAIWRGNWFYTAMHVLFSMFWTYAVFAYCAALKMVWSG